MLLPEIQQQLARAMGCTKPKLGMRSSSSTQADFTQTSSTEKGLTLLECLMAVTVMGLTISLVLPPLLIAAATRVQTRRAEQSLQLAQGEVDRIRNLVAINRHNLSSLPEKISGSSIESAAAPTQVSSEIKTSGNCSGSTFVRTPPPLSPTTVLKVDIDADCQPDLLMQVFRTEGKFADEQLNKTEGERRPAEFDLGVRVYSIVAQSNLGNLDRQQASLGLTNGQKNQMKAPLAVLYTRISWSDRDGTLCSYQRGNSLGTIESCLNY